MSDEFEYPAWRWEPWRRPAVQHLTLGADRHVDNPEPLSPRKPVGFVRRPIGVEPLLWEGDNA